MYFTSLRVCLSVSSRHVDSRTVCRRSSKSRRKTERKKWSLKEGGEHEEHALVDALAKLVKEVDGLKGTMAVGAKCWHTTNKNGQLDKLCIGDHVAELD